MSWFGSRARQDRVNNRAKGMSLRVKGISPLAQISTQKMQGKEANEDSQQNQEKLDLNGSGENRLLCGMWLSSYWCGEAKPEISVAVIKGHRRSLN